LVHFLYGHSLLRRLALQRKTFLKLTMTSASNSSNSDPTWEDMGEQILDGCGDITLRDLMESSTFRCWAMSAICNGINHSRYIEEEQSEKDQFLQYKLYQLSRETPYPIRRALFAQTAELVKINRESRHSQGRN